MKDTTLVASAIAAAGAYFFVQCKYLKNTYYNIYDEQIPKSFEGCKIVQLSDLHNCYFGTKEHNYLIERIKKINPDIVLLTGDFFDVDKYNNSLMIVKELTKLAKVYFTAGGHEYHVPEYLRIKHEMKRAGIIVLDNGQEEIKHEDGSICITGILDPTFYNKNIELMKKLMTEYDKENTFNILLSHRPDLIEEYFNYNYNLIFSGHAHGGQVRIFNQGLYAPNQGILPKYTHGKYSNNKENQHLIINRGIGWHSTFVKVNNRPEIVVCTLHSEK